LAKRKFDSCCGVSTAQAMQGQFGRAFALDAQQRDLE